KLFNDNGIMWQTGGLGKVDEGGAGTIAQYAANVGIDVLDCGVAMLSMHSPFEITSKIDIYVTYNAYKVCRAGRHGRCRPSERHGSWSAPVSEVAPVDGVTGSSAPASPGFP